MEKRYKKGFFRRFRSASTYESSPDNDGIRNYHTLPTSLPSTPDIESSTSTLTASPYATPDPRRGGGYEYEFTEPVPTELLCPICNKVLKEAHQVGCCGKLYCLSCLGNVKLENKMFRCPNCSSFAAVNKFFRDVNIIGKINELDIHCPNKDCTWIGRLNTLTDHEHENCPDELVKCTNSITSVVDTSGDILRVCGLMLPRSRIEVHMSSQCQWRTSLCPHCEEEGVYEYLSGKHLQTCPGLHSDQDDADNQEGPHQGSGVPQKGLTLSPQGGMLSLSPLAPQGGLLSSSPHWGMMSLPHSNDRSMVLSPRMTGLLPPRGIDHTPSTPPTPRVPPRVPLRHRSINRRPRENDDDSASSRSSSGYEDLTTGSLGPYVNFTALYFNNILKHLDTSGSGLKVLKSVIETCGVVRVVTEMKHGSESISSPFYISKGSYKIMMKLVYVNNSIDEDPTKASLLVSVGLVAGRYDDLIKWPSTGRLKLQLLNQRTDVNHKACLTEYRFKERSCVVQDHRDVSWVPVGELWGPFEDFTVLEQSRTVLYFDVITAQVE